MDINSDDDNIMSCLHFQSYDFHQDCQSYLIDDDCVEHIGCVGYNKMLVD